MGTRAAVAVAVIGYLPVLAETGKAGPAAASATISSPQSSRPVRHLLPRSAKRGAKRCAGKRSKSPTLGDLIAMSAAWVVANRLSIRVSADHSGVATWVSRRDGERELMRQLSWRSDPERLSARLVRRGW